MRKIGRVVTALITPFKDGEVDLDGLSRLINFQIVEKAAGVVPVGTTGESPTLSWEEHKLVILRTLACSRDYCGVIAGVGSNSTQETLENMRLVAEAGADTVLMVDCYYNGPSSQELRDQYYAVVAKEFPDITVVPYIIPGRSGTALAVEDLAILADRHPNINTVKEATGDLERMARTRSLLPDGFGIMSGDDDLTYRMITDPTIRANGVISVMSNVIPGAIVRMTDALDKGDLETAGTIRDTINPLLAAVTVKVDNTRVLPNGEIVQVNDRYRNPLPVKTLMAGLGMPSGLCRKPLGWMSQAGVEVIRSAAKQVWETDRRILQPIEDCFEVNVEARLGNDEVWEQLAA